LVEDVIILQHLFWWL